MNWRKTLLVFLFIWGAMIAMSYWASYSEGVNAWDRGKFGWSIHLIGGYNLPAYEFFIFVVMCPLFLSLPLIVKGWSKKLFGVLVSAYFSGMLIEDYLWFVVNPQVNLSQFNSTFASYYPWIKFGGLDIMPAGYLACLIVAFVSWYFLWR